MDGRPSWLIAGRGDLGAGTCTVDVQRSTAVYMGEWFWSDTTSIATGRPGHHHSDFLVFGVLTSPVWALAAVYILLFALLMRLTEQVGRAIRACGRDMPRGDPRAGGPGEGPEDKARRTSMSPRAVASLVDYVQQSIRMFLGQGDDVHSALPATRLLMMFVYMVSAHLWIKYEMDRYLRTMHIGIYLEKVWHI